MLVIGRPSGASRAMAVFTPMIRPCESRSGPPYEKTGEWMSRLLFLPLKDDGALAQPPPPPPDERPCPAAPVPSLFRMTDHQHHRRRSPLVNLLGRELVCHNGQGHTQD